MNPAKTKKAPTAGVLKWQSHLMPVTHRDYEKTKATTPWFCQQGGYSETCYFWKVSSGNPSNMLVYPFPLGDKRNNGSPRGLLKWYVAGAPIADVSVLGFEPGQEVKGYSIKWESPVCKKDEYDDDYTPILDEDTQQPWLFFANKKR